MAGIYPDVPGPRVAYDRDGTVGINLTAANAATVLTAAQLAGLNDESDTGTLPLAVNGSVAFLFPSPITLQGCWSSVNPQYPVRDLTTTISTNTTNGVDGNWTAFRPLVENGVIVPSYRSSIFKPTSPITGVRAIKFKGNQYSSTVIHALHIYGIPETTTDQLAFWHPTLDQPLHDTPAHFDYGDLPQNSAPVTRSFRLKNLSDTLSANNIIVSCQAQTDSSPVTYVSQTQFRYDGGSYAATAALGTLAPGDISQLFDVRLSVAQTASLSAWTQRYIAEAAHWS